jgi:hypothetical protein
MLRIFLISTMTALMGLWVGCASVPPSVRTPAYQGMYDDLAELLERVSAGATTMPDVEARFCLRRAYDDRERAKLNSGLDSMMLVMAGVTGGFGATVGATTAAMNDTSAKKDWQIAGVASVAASAAILGLRTTLALNDLARAQRIAAANSVDAVVDIITAYALADDPKDVKEDGFHTCRDEEINVARAFPGTKNQEAAEKTVSKAAEESKAASAQVADSEAVVASTTAELQKKSVDLEAAEAKANAAKAAAAGSKKPGPALSKEAAEADTQVEALKKQVRDLEAKLKAAQEERRQKQLQAARADVEEARLRVLASSSRLRRTLLFGGKDDVDQARMDLGDSSDDLKRARKRVQLLQRATEQDEPAERPEANP